MDIIKLAATLSIGALGGTLAKKMKFIPAAFMLGSLFIVMIFNLTVGFTYFPYGLRVLTQIMAGAYIGLSITKENLYSIRSMLFPIVVILTQYIIFTLFFGYFLHKLSGIDLITCLYCFAPGGISDLAIIAESVGGDVGMITFMQLVRLIVVFIYYPFFYTFLADKGVIKTNKNEQGINRDAKANLNIYSKDEKIRGFAAAFSISAVGGLIGYFSGVPAGAMVFAMAFSVIANIVYKKTYLPIQIRYCSQIMSGVYLGLSITKESINQITSSFLPVAVMIISIITIPVLFGFITNKITKMDLGTALFCCTPGGMSEMTLLAADMGFDFVSVSISHLARIIVIISVFPHIINLFTKIVS